MNSSCVYIEHTRYLTYGFELHAHLYDMGHKKNHDMCEIILKKKERKNDLHYTCARDVTDARVRLSVGRE